jgi:hypothetical protein
VRALDSVGEGLLGRLVVLSLFDLGEPLFQPPNVDGIVLEGVIRETDAATPIVALWRKDAETESVKLSSPPPSPTRLKMAGHPPVNSWQRVSVGREALPLPTDSAMASTPSPSVPWTGPSKVLQPVE